MKKRIKNYVAYIDQILKENPEGMDYEVLCREHLIQLKFFMHERLIHLLVTLTFAILAFGTFFIIMLTYNFLLVILLFALLILLIPYILHYYLLENSVQRMYEQYDEIRKRI